MFCLLFSPVPVAFPLILILFYILTFLYLTCHFPFLCFPPKDKHLFLKYSSLTLTIYEENMLIHQASPKESICEKIFPINLHQNKCCSPSAFLAVAIASY